MKKPSMKFRLAFAALVAGWCLLFFRCETTEKSMIRVVYLAQTETGVASALWYQAPEASADASEASAALQMVCAEGETLEKSLYAAQKQLPQTADYRLCDFLLIPQDASDKLLSEYESLVLERGCGRTASRVVCVDLDLDEFAQLSEQDDGIPDKLIEKLKSISAQLPRLYQHAEPALFSQLVFADDGVELNETGFFRTPEKRVELSPNETELCLLLQKKSGNRTFWLDGERVAIRRCSVSVTLSGEQAVLRLDCQLPAGEPTPSDAQKEQLENLCNQTVQDLWAQGIDLLSLQQRRALQDGGKQEFSPAKNACPQIRTDVRFLMF